MKATDKTDTINDRRVDVYLDSVEQKARWTEEAEDAEMSVSNFVQNCVEYAIKSGGPDFITAGEQAGEIQQLRQKLRQKEETIEEKDIVIEKLQTELKRHRTAPFRDEDFSGVRQFDTELIDILQDSGSVRSERMLRELNVDPQNTDLIQALQAQLRQLEQYGLVEETLHGWRWVDGD